MARGINKCIFIGNLGKDPDVRYTPEGKAVANFSIAVSDQWKDKNTNEKKERTEWVRVVCFGKLAEICAEYVKKGAQLYVEGKMQTRKWTNKDGVDQYTTEVVAVEFQMLGSRSQNAARQDEQSDDAGNRAEPIAAQDEFKDDVPF